MNKIEPEKAPGLAALLCALAASACASSVGRVSTDPLEKLTIQCERQVGSLHPRSVIARPLVERCMKRHEAMRIREQLRGIESVPGTRS